VKSSKTGPTDGKGKRPRISKMKIRLSINGCLFVASIDPEMHRRSEGVEICLEIILECDRDLFI
jgi:hypothetical protein